MKRTSSRGKVLSISTSFPTLDCVPTSDDQNDVSTVDPGKTKTGVYWPDNWHLLSPVWRAAILARLVKRVIEAVLSGGSPRKREETFTAFKKLTGWGNVE